MSNSTNNEHEALEQLRAHEEKRANRWRAAAIVMGVWMFVIAPIITVLGELIGPTATPKPHIRKPAAPRAAGVDEDT